MMTIIIILLVIFVFNIIAGASKARAINNLSTCEKHKWVYNNEGRLICKVCNRYPGTF